MLVTRPAPGAQATAARLAMAGFQPVVTPFLQVRACATRLPRADRLQAVVAASGNAVALPDAYHALPLLAVGNATAARARAAGFATVHSADGDAADLVALASLVAAPDGGRLLLAAGHGQGSGLAAALRRAGFTVQRRAVYAAASVRRFPAPAAAAIGGGLHAALFFSAATASAFARLLPPSLRGALRDTDAVVIGADAAAALQHLPWRALRVALRPTQDGILALL